MLKVELQINSAGDLISQKIDVKCIDWNLTNSVRQWSTLALKTGEKKSVTELKMEITDHFFNFKICDKKNKKMIVT